MLIRSVCLILILSVAMPGCSRFTKSGRMDRAYYKQLAQVKKAREERRKQLIHRQRAEEPSLRNSPAPLQENVQTSPDSQ